MRLTQVGHRVPSDSVWHVRTPCQADALWHVLSLYDKVAEPEDWGAAKKAYLDQVALVGKPAAPSTSCGSSSDAASSGMD